MTVCLSVRLLRVARYLMEIGVHTPYIPVVAYSYSMLHTHAWSLEEPLFWGSSHRVRILPGDCFCDVSD